MTNKFQFPKPDTLYYGVRSCLDNHTDPKGRFVKYKLRGCWACACHLPPGQFDNDFGDLPQQVDKRIKHFTDEEKRKARVECQMRWNKRNPDKIRQYHTSYNETHKERITARYRQQYAVNEEFREKSREGYRDYYDRNREEVRARSREYYYRKNYGCTEQEYKDRKK
jgi:hypothetical protein